MLITCAHVNDRNIMTSNLFKYFIPCNRTRKKQKKTFHAKCFLLYFNFGRFVWWIFFFFFEMDLTWWEEQNMEFWCDMLNPMDIFNTSGVEVGSVLYEICKQKHCSWGWRWDDVSIILKQNEIWCVCTLINSIIFCQFYFQYNKSFLCPFFYFHPHSNSHRLFYSFPFEIHLINRSVALYMNIGSYYILVLLLVA